jgi:hypothetical protein
MRKLAQFAARLYPRAWRERYGAEFHCLLADVNPSWRDVLDVLKGGIEMRITHSKIVLITAVFAVSGAAAGGLVGLMLPKQFKSTGLIHVQVWSPSPVLAAAAVDRLATTAFSREKLKQLIDEYDLYHADRARRPLGATVERMRHDLHIQPRAETAFQVFFDYPDRGKAKQVVLKLMEHFVEANLAEHSGLHDLTPTSFVTVLAIPDQANPAGLVEVHAASPSAAPARTEAERLARIVFSREILEQVIDDYDLYREDRAKRPLEEVVQRMQRDIQIEPHLGTALQVSFTYRDPGKAQQVASKLMQHFIESNLVDRSRSDHLRKLACTLRITPADMPILSQAASSRTRVRMMGAGLGGGLLLGLGISLIRRRFLRPPS